MEGGVLWEPHFQKTCHLYQEVGHPLTLLIRGLLTRAEGLPQRPLCLQTRGAHWVSH